MEKYITLFPDGRHSIILSIEDIELARLYNEQHMTDRGRLGILLEREGMGAKHYLFSRCYDRIEYIMYILDQIVPENN